MNKELLVFENYFHIKNFEFLSKKCKEMNVVFLCLGNPKIWYDSYGPIMGSLLKLTDLECFIYGNIKSPITAKNIKEYVKNIYSFHNNPYIVVFDTEFSNDIRSSIRFKKGPIKCACFSDESILIGDYCITYIVNSKIVKDYKNFEIMLSVIKNMFRNFCFSFNKL